MLSLQEDIGVAGLWSQVNTKIHTVFLYFDHLLLNQGIFVQLLRRQF